jgi:hypothetical protein
MPKILPVSRAGAIYASLGRPRSIEGTGVRPFLLLLGALGVAGALPAAAADLLQLQQTLQPGTAGRTYVLIDRSRISSVQVERGTGTEQTITVTLDPESKPRFTFRCIDEAAVRQLLDALRPGGMQVLDVTSRCRL